MDQLPLFLDLRGRPVLLIGAGEVAERKLDSLLRAQATVRIVALAVSAAVADRAREAGIDVAQRGFVPEDLDGVWLVVAATGDVALNAELAERCEARQLWLNVVDDTPRCSAIFPSIVDRDPLLVAISTGGRSPTLARWVRGMIEERLPAGLAELTTFIGERRRTVSDRLPSIPLRQRFWGAFLDRQPLASLVSQLRSGAAAEDFEHSLDAAVAAAEAVPVAASDEPEPDRQMSGGRVALVGGGPGDPELITLRGLNLIREADVLLYDNLVGERLLDYARRDAEKVYVGKKRAVKGIRQDTINELLVSHARRGAQVVRLKGGDPFIFGRGGEEIEALAAAGIPFEVVPGISAALGGASYAGIPLTHRTVAQSVRFVTGHRAADRANLDWPELARADQTLVIYMGLPALATILERLRTHGLPAATPAALIERATLPEQRVIVGNIENLAARVAEAEVKGPTLIIIGQVVGYRTISPDAVGSQLS